MKDSTEVADETASGPAVRREVLEDTDRRYGPQEARDSSETSDNGDTSAAADSQEQDTILNSSGRERRRKRRESNSDDDLQEQL